MYFPIDIVSIFVIVVSVFVMFVSVFVSIFVIVVPIFVIVITLLYILERGVTFRVIDRCRDLNLRDTNLKEICLCYENIAERLLNEEYKLLVLVFPNNIYMKCINSLVFSTDRPCDETCWFHILPRQIRFHITYYQHLMWYADCKYTKSTATLDN